MAPEGPAGHRAPPFRAGARHRRQLRRRAVRLALAQLASALLHLVVFLVLGRLPDHTRLARLPVRYRTPPSIPSRLAHTTLPRTPEVSMRPITVPARARPLPPDLAHLPGGPILPAPLPAGRLGPDPGQRLGARGDTFTAAIDTLPSLETLQLAALRRRLEALSAYRRRRLPDADRTDAESAHRARGRRVVAAAIEAMGGAAALTAVTAMALAPAHPPPRRATWEILRFAARTRADVDEELALGYAWFRRRGLRHQYAANLPGGGRLVWDGRRAFIVTEGTTIPVAGDSLVVVRTRAERWDFLSRYVGDGVEVSWLAARRGDEGQLYDLVRVDDYRFGGLAFRARFDRDTHLLTTEEYPAHDPIVRRRFLDYGPAGTAWLWHAVETSRTVAAGRDCVVVAWSGVPDSLFTAPTDSVASISRRSRETRAATLWVTVRWRQRPVSGTPVVTRAGLGLVSHKETRHYRRRVLRDTSRYLLTDRQKPLAATQLCDAALRRFRAEGLFARVAQLPVGAAVPDGDYLLVLWPLSKRAPKEIRGRVFYGAEVFHQGRTGRRRVVADGPLPDFYFGQRWGGMIPPDERPQALGGARWVAQDRDSSEILHKDCARYRLDIYVVDTSAAYVSGARLRERLDTTCVKLARALRAEAAGESHRFDDPCCYCATPR